jgi:diguanylate cyclase (GGDEF)-like protein
VDFEMKKLYELDASKEFDDIPSEAGTFDGGGTTTAGNFEGVSGVGVETISDEEDEQNINNLQEMLAKLNTHSDEDMAKAVEEEEAERERYRLEEEERLRLAKERYNRERYEKEQEALAKKREQDAIEEARRLEEEEEAKKNSFGYKFKQMLTKKNSDEVSDEYEEEKPKKSLFKRKPKEEKEYEDEEVEVTSTPSYEEFAPEPEEIGFEVEEEETGKKKFSLSSIIPQKKEKPVKEKVVKEKPTRQPAPVSSSDDEPDWKWIATHDELTGLFNTRAYAEDLKTMPTKLGVVFFDINNLKIVNDTYTHNAGDRLIKGVVSVLKEVFGEDHLYRTGGDEFVYLIERPEKNADDKIFEKSNIVHKKLEALKKQDPDHITYSVSIGYAFGDGKASREDVVKAADAAMYQNKKAYKMKHKNEEKKAEDTKKSSSGEKPQVEHDELLTKEQKQLKSKIKDEHEKVSKGSTQVIIREIQKRASEIEAIFIASPTFDHLFVITDIEDFLDIMEKQQALIDYSSLYIVYSGGPQYYGADEYYKEVTHLFENVSDALMSGKFRSEKDIQSIPGINIFKNIYV